MAHAEKENHRLGLLPGDVIEIRSRTEILQSLDNNGELDQLPLMPEMLQFCGQKFTVFRRADKTCDTIDNQGALRMRDAVHLENLRCDGESHGGCQAECLLYWKESWLKKPDESSDADLFEESEYGCSEDTLHSVTARKTTTDDHQELLRYSCQATELKRAATPLAWWDIRQYIRDIRTGNATLFQLIKAGLFAIYRELVHLGIGYRYLIRFYDWLQERTGGDRFPFRSGKLTGSTPTEESGLEVGEYVRTKSHEEILETLNQNNKNRGLWFDAGMVPYCGKIFRVAKRVNIIINEKTGYMMNFKNPCIILENVYCRGKYTKLRLFCPRSTQLYWREIWLDRVAPDDTLSDDPPRK